MNRFFLWCICVFTTVAGQAQKLSAHDLRLMLWAEDTLQMQSRTMIMDVDVELRLKADSQFTRLLVKTLRRPYSFYFPFDSVASVSKLVPPDSSFRIFTWQVALGQNRYRQKGAIQMNTADGSLKLFPLNDVSEYDALPHQKLRKANEWIGAIYYKIITEKENGNPRYTLFGYDDYNERMTRKWIEVLRFDEEGKPLFGGEFKYRPEPIKTPLPAQRFLLEFQKNAGCRLSYDSSLRMIVFEHLVSMDNKPEVHEGLLPDGDYEGFTWQNGVWVHSPELPLPKTQQKVTDLYLGNAPVEATIRDANGQMNEAELDRRSEESLARYGAAQKAEMQRKQEAAKERLRLKGKPPTAEDYRP